MIAPGAPGDLVIAISIVLLVLATAGTISWLYFAARKVSPDLEATSGAQEEPRSSEAVAAAEIKPTAISYTNDAIEKANADCLKLAFAVTRFDYQILGEHAEVLERINGAVEDAAHQRDYFPRRPMLLPKLMQALNNPESSREDLARLILEDPAIAGGVLQQANTAFYRVSPARVDSIDRAVWLLGTDGLRRLMATAIMQPVFRLPKGYFDHFAPYTWEQAQRAAAAAEAYAQTESECDSFVAQLLAVLAPLARIVVFRLAMDKYRDSPNILPRAEVFIRAMQKHAPRVALRIATAWELTHDSIGALRDQAKHASPSTMRALSRSIYFAELASTLSLLAAHSDYAEEECLTVLGTQGLEDARAQTLWRAAQLGGEAR